MKIFIDADGCPVKKEVYRVAQRYELEVTLVANAWMKTPDWTEFILVDDDLDAADNWIAEHVEENDIVITSDIPLASRCLNKEACVIGSRGRFFTDDNIGNALATRELQSQLRDAGIMTRGPSPLQKKDRSKFLQSLDLAIQKIRRKIAKQTSEKT